ncbi:MAG: pyridoxal phosphate-dependent aminotransferase [Myxococcota bacterium]
MSTRTSKRAKAIHPSLIREIRAHARPTSLDLGLGQSDLLVCEPARRAIAEAARRGHAPYGPNLGDAPMREAVAARYGIHSSEVMITSGVQEALAVALLGLVDAGDEVLVPDPGFPAYPNLVRAAGATPVPYTLEADQGWALNMEALEDAIGPSTRAIVLNAPGNPTGTVLGAEELDTLLGLLARRGIIWVSDEIYEDYVYTGQHVSPASHPEHGLGGVRLSGLSKSHHMMGWRLGWLTGPTALVEELKPLHQHLVTSASTLIQAGGAVALEHHDEVVSSTMEVFRTRRQIAHELGAKLPGITFAESQGAFYMFLNAAAHMERFGDSLGLCRAILDDVDVITVPGSGFGPAGEGHVRVAYTVDDDTLRDAFERLRAFFEQAS